MIGSIKGKIILKTDKFAVIEANGVGYKISVSPDFLTKAKEDAEVFLWIHSHIREDSFDLYGFLDYEELEFFEMLINVSGIGPKGALTILSVATIDTLKRAIKTSDLPYLTKISGIGKKTAEKMVIELRDKIGVINTEGNLRDELDALEALKSLGYSQNEAREAIKDLPADMDTSTKVRNALKVLGRK
jgi:Holliday junction DNA helicase RuvA